MNYKLTYNNITTFRKPVYRCHYFTEEQGQKFESIINLRGFNYNTFDTCLLNLVSEQYDPNYFDFNIVADIANKLVILTIKGKNYFRKVTFDKIERISDIEE